MNKPYPHCKNNGIDICSDWKLSDLEYAGNFVFLLGDADKLWILLNRLNGSVCVCVRVCIFSMPLHPQGVKD